MSRLLIVSNRLPLTVQKRKGNFHFQPSVGGLATGLRSFYKSHDSIWIGWPGVSREELNGREKELKAELMSEDCQPVFLTESQIDGYYHGFSNKTIWPLFHYFPLHVVYDKHFWQYYEKVNKIFANAVVRVAEDDDIIWIHDYHLMLLPRLIRERLPTATVGFFSHIPFPGFEMFRLLPWRRQILNGLLGADLVGFHTHDYSQHFLDSVHRLLGHDIAMGQIAAADRIVKADAFPMGIDYEQYSTFPRSRKVRAQIRKFRERLGDRRVILSIDRLDYTKGILQRLEAFGRFLETNPRYKERLSLLLVVVPSRVMVEPYAQLKKRIDELVGAINGKHGSFGWSPIWYLYRSLPFHTLVAMYKIADIALITPLRDGMNLIAKEFIATKTDGKGILILSETAGAAQELGEAIIINANNQERIVQALEEALTMSEEEQIKANRVMQERLQRYNVVRWADDFKDTLLDAKKMREEMKARIITHELQEGLVSDFRRSSNRLILLDYDGTLTTFANTPESARPGEELLRLLNKLTAIPKTEVVIISGRGKETLEEWFGELNLELVAEHGAWVKGRGVEWTTIQAMTGDWKGELRPILELWVDRTPGSFIEEKDFSLVWHYRRVTSELGNRRARELASRLLDLTANLDLQVLEGKKVIEIGIAGINKGRAALQWISKEEWDFILAIGDDWTDEDVFKTLPASAWSIKVGLSASAAKFNLTSVKQVRALLSRIIERLET